MIIHLYALVDTLSNRATTFAAIIGGLISAVAYIDFITGAEVRVYPLYF
jgi:hypothetical protein